jgi:hypothetical protein
MAMFLTPIEEYTLLSILGVAVVVSSFRRWRDNQYELRKANWIYERREELDMWWAAEVEDAKNAGVRLTEVNRQRWLNAYYRSSLAQRNEKLKEVQKW